jgi:hypothetical protein
MPLLIHCSGFIIGNTSCAFIAFICTNTAVATLIDSQHYGRHNIIQKIQIAGGQRVKLVKVTGQLLLERYRNHLMALSHSKSPQLMMLLSRSGLQITYKIGLPLATPIMGSM